ncbi:c2H2-type domain-containing protein [Trichonephila clavipes]|uniref:C2H2-type domain-containing protein n=1 Tax=Trichonephila clavipes TaxID=2585209 RepID=A0A8X6S7X5_TRICX|nr:c2H2-type domain-containing protein [Trichonephila clavipes]
MTSHMVINTLESRVLKVLSLGLSGQDRLFRRPGLKVGSSSFAPGQKWKMQGCPTMPVRKLKEGVSEKIFLQGIREEITVDSGRKMLIEKKDIHNIKRDFNINGYVKRHEINAANVKLRAEELKNNGENCFVYFKEQGQSGNDYCLKDEDFVLLKTLESTCEFAEQENGLIRDRIVLEIKDSGLQERLSEKKLQRGKSDRNRPGS